MSKFWTPQAADKKVAARFRDHGKPARDVFAGVTPACPECHLAACPGRFARAECWQIQADGVAAKTAVSFDEPSKGYALAGEPVRGQSVSSDPE